jgi:energy-coupling factor transport system substrate-specific component
MSVVEPQRGWRTVDIVVAAVIAVAFGVIFWAWSSFVWAPTSLFFEGFAKPAQYVLSGVYLMPAVLGGLVIRKPGAALFTELVAAAVSALLGSQWGLVVILSGVVQGAGAELIFAFTAYRVWGLPVAVLAAVGASIGEWLHDMTIYFPETTFDAQLAYGVFMLASAVVIAGIGSWLLTRALADTGVLSPFSSGRSQRTI